MSDDETYSPLARTLLAAERERPGPTADVKATIVAGLRRAPLAPTRPDATAVSVSKRVAVSSLLGAFAAGLAAGAFWSPRTAVHPNVSTPSERTSNVAPGNPSVALPTPRLKAVDSAATPPPALSVVAPVVRPGPHASARVDASEDNDLRSQRTLLERARSAVARHDAEAALEALEAHAQIAPQSPMREEREALRVQALAKAGRLGEARQAAIRFEAEFPESLFGARVRGAVATP